MQLFALLRLYALTRLRTGVKVMSTRKPVGPVCEHYLKSCAAHQIISNIKVGTTTS